MKKCPYCAEEIQDQAIKCKHCGEFLEGHVPPNRPAQRGKWYFNWSTIVIAIGCLGPLALPLLWWRPNTARGWKIGITVLVLAFTWFMYRATISTLNQLDEAMQGLNGY